MKILKLVGGILVMVVGTVAAAMSTDYIVKNIEIPSPKKNSDDNVEPIEVVPELVEEA